MTPIITGLFVAIACAGVRAQEGSSDPRARANQGKPPETRPAVAGEHPPIAVAAPNGNDAAADEARRKALAEEVTALKAAVQRLGSEKPAKPFTSLTVNGEVLPKLVIDREMIYLVGSRQLQQKIIEMLIDEQIEEQIKKGENPRKFEILEKDIDDQIKTTKTEWEKANPDKGNFADYLRATNTSTDEYRTMVRNQKIFDGIFFDGHPSTWPDVTGEAIMASGGDQGETFWKRFRDSVNPIYFANKDVTWAALDEALKGAGLARDKWNVAGGEASAKVTLPEAPASKPAVGAPAGPATSELTIKVESKAGAADRTEVRITAVNAADEANEAVQKAKNSIRDLIAKSIGQSLGKPPKQTYTGEVPPFWLGICRGWVIKKLIDWSDVRYASNGLPDDMVLMVNGKGWRTEDASKIFLQKAKPEDFERAMTEIALRTALRQELRKAPVVPGPDGRSSYWLSDEEFTKEYKTYSEPFDKTPFTVEVIAMTFKGYPTMEAFKQRWRLLKSYENMIAKEIHNANLTGHIPLAKNFLGDARVNVQYIRLPAFDDATGTWRENGWSRAKVEAETAMDAIQKGMSFDEAIKTFGRFKQGDPDGGRIGPKSFNELRQKLGESEYLDFVNGYSIAQMLLNETKEGQVIGPLRANDGYVIAKLVSRVPPGGNVSVEDEKTRELIKQDYISTRFLRWAGEVAAKMKLE